MTDTQQAETPNATPRPDPTAEDYIRATATSMGLDPDLVIADMHERVAKTADPEIPATQVMTLTTVTAADVYLEGEEVLAHLRRAVEDAERRAEQQRVPGKVFLTVTTCITTDPVRSTLKG